MRVKISITDRQRILDHAAGSRDEVCGLLLGTGAGSSTDEERRIMAVRACTNVSETPAYRFELDPAVLIAAWRDARGGGPQVLGHYHSHPSGNPFPSITDAAEAAADGAVWIIVGNGRLTAWQAVADGAVYGRFDPVELIEAAG